MFAKNSRRVEPPTGGADPAGGRMRHQGACNSLVSHGFLSDIGYSKVEVVFAIAQYRQQYGKFIARV